MRWVVVCVKYPRWVTAEPGRPQSRVALQVFLCLTLSSLDSLALSRPDPQIPISSFFQTSF